MGQWCLISDSRVAIKSQFHGDFLKAYASSLKSKMRGRKPEGEGYSLYVLSITNLILIYY